MTTADLKPGDLLGTVPTEVLEVLDRVVVVVIDGVIGHTIQRKHLDAELRRGKSVVRDGVEINKRRRTP